MKTVVALSLFVGVVATGCFELDPLDVDTETEAIVGGTVDHGDPAVAHLVARIGSEGWGCTGTLISPRTILTAAHCLDEGGTVDSIDVYFGTVDSIGDSDFIERREGVDYTYYPGWSVPGPDIGLILLDREAITPPVPFNRTLLNSSYEGQNLRIVGWGITSSGGNDDGTKRQMTTDLQQVPFESEYVLGYGRYDENTCQGDSGGPGFMTVNGQEVVASITSYGYDYCQGISGGTRVAKFVNWIDNWIASHDQPTPPTVNITKPTNGATVKTFFHVEATVIDDVEVKRAELYVNGNLSSTVTMAPFIFNASVPSAGPATIEVRGYDNGDRMGSDSISVTVDTSCTGPSDCPEGTNCEGGECVPASGGIGDTCADGTECISGLCIAGPQGQVCSQYCDVGGNNCPANYECTPTTGDSGVCIGASGGGDDGDVNGGICSAGPGSRGGFVWILLAGVGACLARRRRRQRAQR